MENSAQRQKIYFSKYVANYRLIRDDNICDFITALTPGYKVYLFEFLGYLVWIEIVSVKHYSPFHMLVQKDIASRQGS